MSKFLEKDILRVGERIFNKQNGCKKRLTDIIKELNINYDENLSKDQNIGNCIINIIRREVLEDDLIDLIEEEYKEFYDDSDIDEDGFDIEYFAKVAKESIEEKFGKIKFDDFNIESYAISYAENKEAEALEVDYE